MDIFLYSLRTAAIFLVVCAAILAITVIPRMYMLWQRKRTMTVSVPCSDVEQGRFHISEAFKALGSPTPPQADGAFTIEPAAWRRKLGLKTLTVHFPQPQTAVLTGQANALKAFARTERLTLVPEPSSSFGGYFKPKLKWFYLVLVVIFLGSFVITYTETPNGVARQHHVAS